MNTSGHHHNVITSRAECRVHIDTLVNPNDVIHYSHPIDFQFVFNWAIQISWYLTTNLQLNKR